VPPCAGQQKHNLGGSFEIRLDHRDERKGKRSLGRYAYDLIRRSGRKQHLEVHGPTARNQTPHDERRQHLSNNGEAHMGQGAGIG
jgi:hypothetical protein